MDNNPTQIVQAICNQNENFANAYRSYRSDFEYWAANDVLSVSQIKGKRILDWECGSGVFTAIFAEEGAAKVTAIDSWLDTNSIDETLSVLPHTSFHKNSIEELAQDQQNHGSFDLIFANTVTEHLPNLARLMTLCYKLLAINGELVLNHDNYYQPVGSHDHGFLFYSNDNEITFQGPRCWESQSKCEESAEYRKSVSKRFSWTWTEWNEKQLTPDNCKYCPYYRRAQPWAHLLYQQEFRQVFPHQCFTSGYPSSGLNKITPFQLRQFLIEAGFNIERWLPSHIKNQPPQELLEPPFNFNSDDLCTAVIAIRCSKAALPRQLHWTSSIAN